MLNQTEILNFIRINLPELKSEYHLSTIGLFGSFARNEQNENSDIDILLEFEPGTQNIYEKKTRLKEFFRASFHRDVDLCREKYVKPYVKDYLQKEVIYV
jgi:uncharacterized protein